MSSFSANFLMWTAVRKLARRCGFALTRQRHVLSRRELDYGDAVSTRRSSCSLHEMSWKNWRGLKTIKLGVIKWNCIYIYIHIQIISNTFSARPRENLPPKLRSSSWPVKEESKALEQSLEVQKIVFIFSLSIPQEFQKNSKRNPKEF